MPERANITNVPELPLICVPDGKGGTRPVTIGLLDRPPQGLNVVERSAAQARRKPVLRCFKTPDGSRVVGGAMLYEDLNARHPYDTWVVPETPLPTPYEIREIEGKGRGMIARRDIMRGEAIIHERPVLLYPVRTFGTIDKKFQQLDENLPKLVEMLEPEDRDKLLQLHNCKSPDECGPITGIARTNGIVFHVPDSVICAQYASVCLNISYANHSCNPNAYYGSDIHNPTFTLSAYRDISKGEEITIGYILSSNSRVERQAELLKKYGFTCTCEECLKPINPASEERRHFIATTIKSLDSMWENFVKSHPRQRKALFKKDLETVEKTLRFMKQEKISERRIQALQHIAFSYCAMGDMKSTRKWGKECLKECLEMADGEEFSRMWEGWLKNPTLIPMWDILH